MKKDNDPEQGALRRFCKATEHLLVLLSMNLLQLNELFDRVAANSPKSLGAGPQTFDEGGAYKGGLQGGAFGSPP